MSGKNDQKNSHSLWLGVIADWLCKLITLLSFVGLSAQAIYYSVQKTWKEHGVIFICSVLTIFILCTVIYLGKKFNREIVSFFINLISRNTPYSIIERNITYEYVNEETMRLKQTFYVKARQTGVNSIVFKCNWSGNEIDEHIDFKPIKEDDYSTSYVKYTRKDIGYNVYELYSCKQINKGNPPIKLGIDSGNIHPTHKLSHHLSAKIDTYTDKLTMIVILPYNIKINVNSIEANEYVRSTDEYHWHQFSINQANSPLKIEHGVNNETRIILKVNKPLTGGRYLIKWEPQPIEKHLDSTQSVVTATQK